MKAWQQAVLGVVQGVAEVVPVSSSAQLHLLPWLLRWDPVEDRTSFAAGLHAGSALGIAAAVRPRASELPQALAATVPAALVGLVAQGVIERRLGRPGPTAALLAAAGLGLLVADRRPQAHPVQDRDIAVAGTAQIASLAPGVSRSGISLTALRLRQVDRDDALRTSLVMSLPVTLGAAALTAARARQAPPALPTALAAMTSYAVAKRVSPRWFTAAGLYRVGLATVVALRLRKDRR